MSLMTTWMKRITKLKLESRDGWEGGRVGDGSGFGEVKVVELRWKSSLGSGMKGVQLSE
jgi:hypothetical protein